jgi:hypothetical protein
MNNLSKAIADFKSIDTAADLKKHKLTLCAYDTLGMALSELSKTGITETINDTVKEWFTKRGFTSKEKGIGWQILQ